MAFWEGKVHYLSKGLIILLPLDHGLKRTCLPRNGPLFLRGAPLALSLTCPSGIPGLYLGQGFYPLGQKEIVFA